MQKNNKEQEYNETQFCRYISNSLHRKICDLDTVLSNLYDGRLFDAEKRVRGMKDTLLFLRSQCEKRLQSIDDNSENNSDIKDIN